MSSNGTKVPAHNPDGQPRSYDSLTSPQVKDLMSDGEVPFYQAEIKIIDIGGNVTNQANKVTKSIAADDKNRTEIEINNPSLRDTRTEK